MRSDFTRFVAAVLASEANEHHGFPQFRSKQNDFDVALIASVHHCALRRIVSPTDRFDTLMCMRARELVEDSNQFCATKDFLGVDEK